MGNGRVDVEEEEGVEGIGMGIGGRWGMGDVTRANLIQ